MFIAFNKCTFKFYNLELGYTNKLSVYYLFFIFILGLNQDTLIE